MIDFDKINSKVSDFLNELLSNTEPQERIQKLKNEPNGISELIKITKSEFGFTEEEWKQTIKEFKNLPYDGEKPRLVGIPGMVSGINVSDGREALKLLPPNLLKVD